MIIITAFYRLFVDVCDNFDVFIKAMNLASSDVRVLNDFYPGCRLYLSYYKSLLYI